MVLVEGTDLCNRLNNIYHVKSNHKRDEMAMLIFKVDFKTKTMLLEINRDILS